jgi:tight adherence protein C
VLADLLALAVSAGATPTAALTRSAAVLQGPLARRLEECLGRLRTGTPLVDGLDELAARAQVPSLTRLVEAIAQAHGRGTPLTEVMRAQAADARSEERRRLLESAGRKDVAMLVPIVFLVLPTVIVIAIFPGLSALEVIVP